MKRIPVSSIKTKAQHVAAHRKLWREVIGILEEKHTVYISVAKERALDRVFIGNLRCDCFGCRWDAISGECLFICGCKTKNQFYPPCCYGLYEELEALDCITDNARALVLARKILNMKIRGSK